MTDREIIAELRDVLADHFPDQAARGNALLDLLVVDVPPQPFLGKPRHRDWDEAAHAFLLKNPTCAACGTRKRLQVHHKKPFHLHPELELDPDNLIVLCDAPYHHCHFIVGHSMDWTSFNPAVAEDAARQLERIRTRPG